MGLEKHSVTLRTDLLLLQERKVYQLVFLHCYIRHQLIPVNKRNVINARKLFRIYQHLYLFISEEHGLSVRI